jgi:hypothetical protein
MSRAHVSLIHRRGIHVNSTPVGKARPIKVSRGNAYRIHYRRRSWCRLQRSRKQRLLYGCWLGIQMQAIPKHGGDGWNAGAVGVEGGVVGGKGWMAVEKSSKLCIDAPIRQRHWPVNSLLSKRSGRRRCQTRDPSSGVTCRFDVFVSSMLPTSMEPVNNNADQYGDARPM